MRLFAFFLATSLSLASSVVVAQSDYLKDDQIQVLHNKTDRAPMHISPVKPGTSRTVIRRACRASETEIQERKLLYLYPRSSVTSTDDILATMNKAVSAINLTINNSRSGPYRAKLVAVEPVDYVPGATLFNDLTWMFNATEVAVLDKKYGPNLTIGLWVEGPVTDAAIGIAAGGFGSSLPPYHVIRLLGDPTQTAVHEWGHGMGMNHQEQDPQTGPGAVPAFSYGWFDPGDGVHTGRRDVMAIWRADLCPRNCPYAFVFSNPDLDFGVPGKTENYRMVGIAFQSLGSTPACVVR